MKYFLYGIAILFTTFNFSTKAVATPEHVAQAVMGCGRTIGATVAGRRLGFRG